jgi:hypothetical protein
MPTDAAGLVSQLEGARGTKLDPVILVRVRRSLHRGDRQSYQAHERGNDHAHFCRTRSVTVPVARDTARAISILACLLALSAFRQHVTDLWRRTLRRRSQRDGTTWDRMAKLADDWLPKPHILHPWPSQRFAVTHPR